MNWHSDMDGLNMKGHRTARVAEVIREVAAEAILFELKDPRVKMVTVTRAEVSGDLQHGKVYVSVMGSDAEQLRTIKALNHAAGFVQSRLADRMRTRFIPALTFVLDKGVKNAIEVARLINEAKGQSPTAEQPEPTEENPPQAGAADGMAD
jgi:ribosome-binding factor A